MNYAGRVIGSNFNSVFLKEILLQVTENEDIFYLDEKVYECYFHGGIIR